LALALSGMGSIGQRNQPVLQAAAGSVTRPGHNLWSIRAPTPVVSVQAYDGAARVNIPRRTMQRLLIRLVTNGKSDDGDNGVDLSRR
jgi:hypothetical protein